MVAAGHRKQRQRCLSGVRNFLQSLAAVLVGNAVYFLVAPHLPVAVQHAWSRIDPGLIVDFGFCAVALVVIKKTMGEKAK